MQFQIIKKIHASADANAHPTIPFVPPGGNTTPTPTPSGVEKGPHIRLESNQDFYAVGEEGVIDVILDTDGQEIDEFRMVIQYDSSHIRILDDVDVQSGTQIEYLDTHFIPFQNEVEPDITGEGSNTGNITVTAQAQNSQPATVSNRTIARIRFEVLSTKTSVIFPDPNQSNLLINSVNILDEDALEELEISSEGQSITTTPTTSTSTLTPTPKITKVPDTALTSNSIYLILIGITLISVGYFLKQQIDSKLSNSK